MRHTRTCRPGHAPKSESLESLRLLRSLLGGGVSRVCAAGRTTRLKRLREFIATGALEYGDERDRPDHPACRDFRRIYTSARSDQGKVREALQLYAHAGDARHKKAADGFLRQLYWREFAHHLLYHFPHTPERPLRDDFASFPWRKDTRQLQACNRGTPAIRLLMPGCGNFGAPAGCTIGCG